MFTCSGKPKDNNMKGQDKKSGGFACFPGHALVETQNGLVRMDQLHENILVRDSDDISFSRVTGFLHASASAGSCAYVSLGFDDGKKFEASANHRVFLADGRDDFAGDVEVGSILASGQQVRDISIVEYDSLFAPVTETGMIYVDGVTASCYADVEHSLAHLVVSLPFKLQNATRWAFGSVISAAISDVALISHATGQSN